MTFYPTDKIALFIDGANLYSAARVLNTDIDFRKLLDEFKKRGVLIRAYYYTAISEDDDYSPIRPLVAGAITDVRCSVTAPDGGAASGGALRLGPDAADP